MAYEDRRTADKSHKRTVAERMRRGANVDESDDTAPTLQLWLLPGDRAPAYLTAQDEEDGGFAIVSYLKALEADHRFAIEERRRQVAKISRRADDLEVKLQVLKPYMTTDQTTTEEALARMAEDEDGAA